MKFDYDLSDLKDFQVDLWLFLRVDAISAEILAGQANRQASIQSKQSQSRVLLSPGNDSGCLHTETDNLPGTIDLGALNGLLSKPVLSSASPTSSVVLRFQVTSPWIH